MGVTFVIEKKSDDNGQISDHIIKKVDGQPDESWGSIPEFDRLFDACSTKWKKHGWDLNKLITCVNECEFE